MQRMWWLLAFVAACGDNVAAVPSAKAPPRPPHVSSAGGPVLVAPKIVPIFFAGDDDMQHQLEAFLAAIATSDYWTATTSEYGVGPPVIAASVVLTDAPPTTDDLLEALLEQYAGTPDPLPSFTGPSFQWPTPDANTLYVVFLPDGVTLTAGSEESCVAFGGYHGETTPSGLVYALLPRCTPKDVPIDAITPALSHELVEAATDPHPGSAPAYVVVDDEDIVWAYTPGGELGDMCEYVHAARQRLVGNYLVQRTWSNVSAAGGHDPCVPALPVPYIAAAPLFDPLDFETSRRTIHTRGIEIPTGSSATIELALFSDAPTAPWTVAADDVEALIVNMPAELSLSLDTTTGGDGDRIKLTITRLKEGQGGGSEIVIRSRVDDETKSMWWGLVAN